MRTLITLIRATRLALHLAYGLMIALVFPWLSSARQRDTLRLWSADLLKILNIHLSATKHMQTSPGIVVSNHISWLDIFVLNAVMPMRFIAKSEVKSWPVIGWLCTRAQTLFIERGRARNAAHINNQVTALLLNGACVAAFPEGTTTDGTDVGVFHASIMQPAIEACAHIYPVAIRYQDTLGVHSTAPAYIDDLPFAASLFNVLSCPNLHVHLHVTPSISAAHSDRRTLAYRAHLQIRTALQDLHAVRNTSTIAPHTREKPDALYGTLLVSPQYNLHDMDTIMADGVLHAR